MQNKKIFILLPDGIGLRNFSFTNFHKIGIDKGFDITFWNNTLFDLNELNIKEIKIEKAKTHPLTDFLKNAQIQIELNQNIKKSRDTIYNHYRFPFAIKDLKSIVKVSYIRWIVFFNNSQKGLASIRKKIVKHERKTKLYFDSLRTLQVEKPAVVFCTNQRTMLAIAPVLAAQDIGIPTATFIFSWDNLPKATKIIETDFYFVWSHHMKNELLYYYPHIKEYQIKVTGTPQFETHFDKKMLIAKEDFFKEYNLDLSKKYICFSGDDITTSPNDPKYLKDTAEAVKTLNAKGFNLGIIFRRCPVDFSDRFDNVLGTYKDEITSINPKWEKIGAEWNTVIPTREDLVLQMNTIFYTELVINLGSSMVFDYVAFNKPCCYINYEDSTSLYKDWSVHKVYNFIHFRSMPNKDTVFWINDSKELEYYIEKVINKEADDVVNNAKKWFKIINEHPPELTSERIWKALEEICNN